MPGQASWWHSWTANGLLIWLYCQFGITFATLLVKNYTDAFVFVKVVSFFLEMIQYNVEWMETPIKGVGLIILVYLVIQSVKSYYSNRAMIM